MASPLRVDHAVSSGTFSLDGETFDVDNNIWVVGDDTECVVIDAPHSVEDILAVVGDRTVKAILLTHAHDDHCRVAPALREAVVAPIILHPDDKPLWELTVTHERLPVGPRPARRLGGPSPARRCVPSTRRDTCRELLLHAVGPRLRVHRRHAVPGRAGRDGAFVLRPADPRGVDPEKLFGLPDDTVVHTGHGEDTTIGAERAGLGG